MDGKIIDLHCHVLPAIDDGSASAEMSLAMLRLEAEQGVGVVCATSHYYADENSIDAFCTRRAAALERLAAVWPEADELPRVLPAAEAAYFRGMAEEPKLDRLCIEGTRTLMLEMPFMEWNDHQIEEVTALALDRQFQVVLVHPERFCTSRGNRRRLEMLAELPIGLQVNAGSLLRWGSRRLALELLQLTKLPLLGSDCHNLTTRSPNLAEGRRVVKKKLGEVFLMQMDENAQRLTAPRTAAP